MMPASSCCVQVLLHCESDVINVTQRLTNSRFSDNLYKGHLANHDEIRNEHSLVNQSI